MFSKPSKMREKLSCIITITPQHKHSHNTSPILSISTHHQTITYTPHIQLYPTTSINNHPSHLNFSIIITYAYLKEISTHLIFLNFNLSWILSGIYLPYAWVVFTKLSTLVGFKSSLNPKHKLHKNSTFTQINHR